MKIATPLQYAGDPRTAADEVVNAGGRRVSTPSGSRRHTASTRPPSWAIIAARTERMQIGAAILNVYSRTPALLAQTGAGLDVLSGGRALLGLGASGPQVVEGWHGKAYDKPLGRTRETVELCRRIWRREIIDHHGITDMPLPAEKGGKLGKPLKFLNHARCAPEIPHLHRGARPRQRPDDRRDRRRLAAALSSSRSRRSGSGAAALAEGAAKRDAGARPAGDRRGHGPGHRRGRGRRTGHSRARSSRSTSAAWAPRARTSTTTWRGRTVTRRPPRRSRTSTSRGRSGRRRRPSRRSSASWSPSAGPRATCASAIEAFREAGVTMLNVVPVGPDPARLIEQVKSWL